MTYSCCVEKLKGASPFFLENEGGGWKESKCENKIASLPTANNDVVVAVAVDFCDSDPGYDTHKNVRENIDVQNF